MNECPEHGHRQVEGCFIRHVRCSHLGKEWLLEQMECVDRGLMRNGRENLARYAQTVAPDDHYSYFQLEGTWEEAEEALLVGRLYAYGHAQYEERWREHERLRKSG